MKKSEIQNTKKITGILNSNRIRILLALQDCKQNICGCDLVEKLEMTKNLLSYHINFLEKNGLIKEERCGQKINYTLSISGEKIVEQIYILEKIIKGLPQKGK